MEKNGRRSDEPIVWGMKVLRRVEEERNILHTGKRRKDNWIGHIWRGNCLLKHGIEGKIEGRIEVTGRQGRRCKLLLDDLKERKGYWKLKDEALDLNLRFWKRLWTCRKRDYRTMIDQVYDFMNLVWYNQLINADSTICDFNATLAADFTKRHGVTYQKGTYL